LARNIKKDVQKHKERSYTNKDFNLTQLLKKSNKTDLLIAQARLFLIF